ncbi:MAG: hypothetical protein KKD41_07520 [Gammaproteobacteria bacterium]|nr:hypothetical protein [Gammaproteobacteria bacterium]
MIEHPGINTLDAHQFFFSVEMLAGVVGQATKQRQTFVLPFRTEIQQRGGGCVDQFHQAAMLAVDDVDAGQEIIGPGEEGHALAHAAIHYATAP